MAAVAVTGGAFSLVGAASPATVPGAPPGTDVVANAAQARFSAQVQQGVEPVAPAPAVVDGTDLAKVAGLADREVARRATDAAAQVRRTAEEQARKQAEDEAKKVAGDCGLNTSGLGPVKPYVRSAAGFIGCTFGKPTMYGVAGRAGASDHPFGRAVDFMVDRATGDRLADCALRNRKALGITYVIWRQRINMGNGWKPMEDRGSVTANHYDHVHISFGTTPGTGAIAAC